MKDVGLLKPESFPCLLSICLGLKQFTNVLSLTSCQHCMECLPDYDEKGVIIIRSRHRHCLASFPECQKWFWSLLDLDLIGLFSERHVWSDLGKGRGGPGVGELAVKKCLDLALVHVSTLSNVGVIVHAESPGQHCVKDLLLFLGDDLFLDQLQSSDLSLKAPLLLLKVVVTTDIAPGLLDRCWPILALKGIKIVINLEIVGRYHTGAAWNVFKLRNNDNDLLTLFSFSVG